MQTAPIEINIDNARKLTQKPVCNFTTEEREFLWDIERKGRKYGINIIFQNQCLHELVADPFGYCKSRFFNFLKSSPVTLDVVIDDDVYNRYMKAHLHEECI